MANFNPAKVEEAIKGITFPASKDDLLECARGNNADQEELDALERLPDQEYDNPTEITEALSDEDSSDE